MTSSRLLRLTVVLLSAVFTSASGARVIAPREHLAAPGRESELGFAVTCQREDGLVAVVISLPKTLQNTAFSFANLDLKNSFGETVLSTTVAVLEQRVRLLSAGSELQHLRLTASYWNSQVARHDLVFEDLSRWLDRLPPDPAA